MKLLITVFSNLLSHHLPSVKNKTQTKKVKFTHVTKKEKQRKTEGWEQGLNCVHKFYRKTCTPWISWISQK
jgi:hypothetical protein